MENPYESGKSRIGIDEIAGDPAPRGVLGAAWDGAKRGFRVAAIIAGVISSLLVVPAIIVTAFTLASGRGLGVPSYFLGGLGVFVVISALGLIIGGVAGLIEGAGRGPQPAMAGSAATLRPGKPPLGVGSRRRRRRVWPWFVGVPLLLVLAAAVVVGAVAGRKVDRRLAAAVAEADRDDPNWRLDDLLANREPVPDAENSAPVMDQILALVPEGWPVTQKRDPGQPSSASEEASEAFGQIDSAPVNARLSDLVTATLRGELKRYAEAVVLARSLANYRRGRHELVIGRVVFDTLLPHVQGARTAARLLAADAAVRAQDGDIDGALDSCRSILAAGRSFGDEPFLISHLVHVAIGESALHATGRARAG